MQLQEPQISDQLGIFFAKINTLNLVPLTKETQFPKEQSLQFDLA